MKTLADGSETDTMERKPRRVARTLRPEEREVLRDALHDGLGQLLTSICFLAGSLQQKLSAQKLPEETEAAEILSLTTRAISETQALVREPDHSAFP